MPTEVVGRVGDDGLAEDFAGLDALDLSPAARPGRTRRLVGALWPKAAAVVLLVGGWQLAVWARVKPDYALPGPGPVFAELWRQVVHDGHGLVRAALVRTVRRALTGYLLAVVVGSLLGASIARVRPLRSAFGSLVTGLQTMPSIAWFPFAVLLFRLSEGAIVFVVVLGAAPSIANGLIAGVDHVPPLLVRAGRVLGADGVGLYRHVVLPAALPGYVSGLKQGWAFAWRSLMAGELLVMVPGHPSLGGLLQNARDNADAQGLLAMMLVVLVLGVAADAVFTRVELAVRRRWGLVER